MDAIATGQGRSERRSRLKAELDQVIAEALEEQRIVGSPSRSSSTASPPTNVPQASPIATPTGR